MSKLNTKRFGDEMMGELVVVTHILQREYPGRGRREWQPVKRAPRTGWVVGTRWVTNGLTPSGTAYTYGDEPAYTETERFRVVLVSLWATENPVKVLPKHCRLATSDDPAPKSSAWTDDWRQAVSEDSKNWPRDEKGRWRALTKEEQAALASNLGLDADL